MKKVIKLVVLAIVVIFVIMVVKDISKNPIQKKETSSEEIPVILDADAYSGFHLKSWLNYLVNQSQQKIGTMKIPKAHFKCSFTLMT